MYPSGTKDLDALGGERRGEAGFGVFIGHHGGEIGNLSEEEGGLEANLGGVLSEGVLENTR